MSVAATESATGVDSAPNSEAARRKSWRNEIHVPAAEYNANVPVADIERDPANRVPTPEAVTSMAAAIEAEGLLQPIVLRDLGGGKYRIIAGEHRWQAFQSLKLKTIAARIFKSEDDLSAARKGLLENSAREALTPIARARRFRQLEELGMKQKEIGALAGGLSQPVVANAMRLLDLPAEVQAAVNDGRLTEAHGVSLARFSKWPRACACIARMAIDHGYSAKALNNEGLPFSAQLEQEQLLERIQIKARYYSDGAIYKLPRHLGSHRDFIVGEHYAYYFLPADPKDNVWAPVKAEQDAARAKVEEAAAAREAKQAAKNGGPSKEALERKKKLAKNKAQRAENVAALQLALDKLKRTPAPTSLLVGIIVESAIAGGYGAKRILEAGELVGVKLPKGLVSANGGFGLRDVGLMRQMDVMDLTRVATATLLAKEVDNANRNAWGLPKNVESVMNSVVKAARKGGAS